LLGISKWTEKLLWIVKDHGNTETYNLKKIFYTKFKATKHGQKSVVCGAI